MWLSNVWEVTKKELVHLRRDRKSIGLTVILPLVAMLSFALAYGDTDLMGITEHRVYPVGFQNFDNGPEGHIFIRQFELLTTEAQQERGFVQTVSFNITMLGPHEDPKERVRSGERYAVIEIPANFTERVRNGDQQAFIFLHADNTKVLIADNMERFTRILLDEAQSRPAADRRAPAQSPPATLVENAHLIDEDVGQLAVFYPGIIALLIAFAALNDISTSVMRERSDGTLGHVFITPMRRGAFLSGKIAAGILLAMLRGLLLLVLGIYVLGLLMVGSWLLYFLIIALVATATLGVGLVIASLASTERSTLVATLILTIVFMFLIGALTPVEYMLPTSQYVAHALPPTYGVDALRRIMLLGQGLGSPAILIDLLALTAGSVLFLGLGSYLFNRKALGKIQ
jgi:ABC-type multidrug transport system permease subunit